MKIQIEYYACDNCEKKLNLPECEVYTAIEVKGEFCSKECVETAKRYWRQAVKRTEDLLRENATK